MHLTSEIYKRILKEKNHRKEIKLLIDNQEYAEDNIISCNISGAIFDKPSIGGCASRQIEIKIFPIGEIARQAKIEVFLRLVFEDQKSEWIPKGVFFFSQRQLDKKTGILTVQGFDSMLKANQQWLTSSYTEENFPMTQKKAVEDIAARMRVSVDERTKLSTLFPVEYPVDENGDLTMWEVLSYIAVSNAGNWVITDEGKLLLLKYGDIPPESFSLITENGDVITFGGVSIYVG